MAHRRARGGGPMATMLALALVTGAARAQAPADSGRSSIPEKPTISLLRGGELGELLAVYVPRPEAEVERMLADARSLEHAAQDEIERARALALDADGRARIMKEELETTRVRRDVYRRSGDYVRTAELEAAFRRQDGERAYLENLRDALRADTERLDAEKVAASARVRALEFEIVVVRHNRELSTRTPTAEAMAQYRAQLREMLEAQRVAADRWRGAAERRKLVAERKLRQLDALTRLATPERR